MSEASFLVSQSRVSGIFWVLVVSVVGLPFWGLTPRFICADVGLGIFDSNFTLIA